MPEGQDLDPILYGAVVDVIPHPSGQYAANASETLASGQTPDSRLGQKDGKGALELVANGVGCGRSILAPPGRSLSDLHRGS